MGALGVREEPMPGATALRRPELLGKEVILAIKAYQPPGTGWRCLDTGV
jgi:hypothetical protein